MYHFSAQLSLVKSISPDVPEAYYCLERQLFGLCDGAKAVYNTWIQLRSALCSGNLNLGMKGARGRYLLVSETLPLFYQENHQYSHFSSCCRLQGGWRGAKIGRGIKVFRTWERNPELELEEGGW
jgi:hypothetical protein